jgi:prepilin-type N-terminal cleavage/methylation domain-containing protein
MLIWRRPRARWLRLASQAGMTLTELMVTLSLLGIVLVPAFTFLFSAQRGQRTASEAVQQQQDARIGLEQFSRSLREGTFPQGYDYTESSIFYSALDYDVTFYSDVDNDGIAEQIHYWLDTTTQQVMRTEVNPDCTQDPCTYLTQNGATATTGTVLSNVRNNDLSACSGQSGSTPLFSYSTITGGIPTPVPTPGGNVDALVDINYVKMTVVVDVTPGKSPTCQTITTTVSLRNWRT